MKRTFKSTGRRVRWGDLRVRIEPQKWPAICQSYKSNLNGYFCDQKEHWDRIRVLNRTAGCLKALDLLELFTVMMSMG